MLELVRRAGAEEAEEEEGRGEAEAFKERARITAQAGVAEEEALRREERARCVAQGASSAKIRRVYGSAEAVPLQEVDVLEALLRVLRGGRPLQG